MENISMKYEPDGIDLDILAELEENSGQTRKQIAKTLRLPLTTVHNRIEKMEKNGIIRGYRAIVDKKKLGKGVAAFIDITVNYLSPTFSQQEIARKIAAMKDVEDVSIVTGTNDLRVKAYFGSTSDMNEFVTGKLRGIAGIDKTNTTVILQEMDRRQKNPLR
jgi:Lrp/AsnC family transcriptional regulator, leucine-responsive regulatory protein